jgi:hypothetical protein
MLCVLPDPPGPPRSLKTTDEKDSVTLDWKPPSEDGGSKVTGFIAYKREEKKDDWVKIDSLKAFDTQCSASGLKFDLGYYFAVAAENEAGIGKVCETSTALKLQKPAGVPSTPVGPLEVSDVQRNSIALKWRPSEDDGGSPITGYIVEKRESKYGKWTSAGTVSKSTTQYVADRLTEKTEYNFRVFAENKVGHSSALETDSGTIAKSPFGEFTVLLTCHCILCYCIC